MIACPTCSHQVAQNALFCPNCGMQKPGEAAGQQIMAVGCLIVLAFLLVLLAPGMLLDWLIGRFPKDTISNAFGDGFTWTVSLGFWAVLGFFVLGKKRVAPYVASVLAVLIGIGSSVGRQETTSSPSASPSEEAATPQAPAPVSPEPTPAVQPTAAPVPTAPVPSPASPGTGSPSVVFTDATGWSTHKALSPSGQSVFDVSGWGAVSAEALDPVTQVAQASDRFLVAYYSDSPEERTRLVILPAPPRTGMGSLAMEQRPGLTKTFDEGVIASEGDYAVFAGVCTSTPQVSLIACGQARRCTAWYKPADPNASPAQTVCQDWTGWKRHDAIALPDGGSSGDFSCPAQVAIDARIASHDCLRIQKTSE